MKRERRAYSRQERKWQVVAFIATTYRAGHVRSLTCYEIAAGLKMRRSSALDRLLLEMVNEGLLEVTADERHGRWPSREYHLARGSYTLPQERTIPIRAAGKVKGQLTLF